MKLWHWTLDDWNAAFQLFTILFVAGTVLTGLGALYTGRRIAARQKQELATTNATITKLQTDLAVQQERAARAERELLEVQERFKPRILSERQQSELFGLLRAYSSLAREAREKNQETFWIVHPRGDIEATEFASMLTNLFVQTGWQPNLRDMPFPTHTTGIEILVRDPVNLSLLAQALKRVFEEAHIPFTIVREPNATDRTYLSIGSKQ
jgi:hypothetical protein